MNKNRNKKKGQQGKNKTDAGSLVEVMALKINKAQIDNKCHLKTPCIHKQSNYYRETSQSNYQYRFILKL